MTTRYVISAFVLLAALIISLSPAPAQDAAARRTSLLAAQDDGVARLAKALQDDDPLVARTAARLLARRGKPALPALAEALQHEDMLVRRTAVMGLGSLGPEALAPLARALQDQHALVRQAAVLSLAQIRPRSERVIELLNEAGKDQVATVREAALQAARGSYSTAQAIRLPKDGWKFRLDPERVGEDQKWFAPDLDDGAWDDIGIEATWQQFGHDYTGVAWYRRAIELPPRERADKVELAFQGVDENAWVWINGQHAGDHAIGPEGWDDPFWLDVTDLLRWGEKNQITVRAMNTAFAGGIWQPVTINVLELAE